MSVYSKLNRPLVVEDYDTAWPALYEAERNRLTLAVNERIVDIQHIGSTSVPNTRAKPVIDIAMAIEHLDDALACVEMLQESGYEYVPEVEAALPDRRFLWRVAPDGQRYHVHLAEVRSDLWKDPIAFRDYLRVNPAVAREYGKLKAELAARCGSDVGAYIVGKTAFVKRALGVVSSIPTTNTLSPPCRRRRQARHPSLVSREESRGVLLH